MRGPTHNRPRRPCLLVRGLNSDAWIRARVIASGGHFIRCREPTLWIGARVTSSADTPHGACTPHDLVGESIDQSEHAGSHRAGDRPPVPRRRRYSHLHLVGGVLTTDSGAQRCSPLRGRHRRLRWVSSDFAPQPRSGQRRFWRRRRPAAPNLRRSPSSHSRRQPLYSGPVSGGLSPRAARRVAVQ